MKMKTVMWAVAIGLVLAASCRKQDIRTVIIRVPGMKTEACRERVVAAIGATAYGVEMDTVEADVGSRTVTLDYDSMKLSLKNIEAAIAEAGFRANEVPPDPAARAKLPEECR